MEKSNFDNLLTEFSPLEESIFYYTGKGSPSLDKLLSGGLFNFWLLTCSAYGEYTKILHDFKTGERKIQSLRDAKEFHAAKKRIIDSFSEENKRTIIDNCISDIKNLIAAMKPAEENLFLYRKARSHIDNDTKSNFPFSAEYRNLELHKGDKFEIKTFTSTAKTPYMEHISPLKYYRYEIKVPKGLPVLDTDLYDGGHCKGEVILPPAKFKVKNLRNSINRQCDKIIEVDYASPLSLKILI